MPSFSPNKKERNLDLLQLYEMLVHSIVTFMAPRLQIIKQNFCPMNCN